MPTLKQLETALINADKAGDEEAARALAAEIKRVRAQGAAQPQKPVTRTQAFLSGAAEALPRMVMSGIELFDKAGRSLGLIDENTPRAELTPQQKAAYDRQFARQREARPNYFAAGQIAGETAITAPLVAGGGKLLSKGGQTLAKAAPKAGKAAKVVKAVGRGAQATGAAIQSGGIGVRAPSKAAVKAAAPIAASKAGRMGLRVAGGAGAGAATAAMTDQDVLTAAATGAAIPVIGTIAKRGIGWTYDLLSKRLGDTRAAEILRNLIADNPDEIAKALRSAPKDAQANTAEFLAEKGLLTPELAAATRIVSASKASKPLEKVAQARVAAQDDLRNVLRGGTTQTEAMGGIAAAKQGVRDVTAPMREQNLMLADVGRTQIVPANLRAQGLQPLDISSVVGKLRSAADEAEFVNPARNRVLSEFANNLERRAAKYGGVIDATGLYELRKNMGSVISDLLGPTDPKTLQAYTAQIIGETQPLIDDAIKTAGGRGWSDYLGEFARGMGKVERQQFERELTKLPEARFAKVMAGDDPDFVKDFFGPGRFDINVELMGPNLPVAQNLAKQISASRAAAQTGLENLTPSQRLSLPSGARSRVMEAMEPGVPNVLVRGLSRMAGGSPGIYGGGAMAEQVEREYANKLAENVLRRLAPSLASPSAASQMLGVRPTSEAIGGAVSTLPPMTQNAMTQFLRELLTRPTYNTNQQ